MFVTGRRWGGDVTVVPVGVSASCQEQSSGYLQLRPTLPSLLLLLLSFFDDDDDDDDVLLVRRSVPLLRNRF